MVDKIRVGLVGANPEGNSWGARGHVPALKGLPEFELKAICTAHEDTSKRAAAAFGAELAFSDYNRMLEHPDVDLVAVAVRVFVAVSVGPPGVMLGVAVARGRSGFNFNMKPSPPPL